MCQLGEQMQNQKNAKIKDYWVSIGHTDHIVASFSSLLHWDVVSIREAWLYYVLPVCNPDVYI